MPPRCWTEALNHRRKYKPLRRKFWAKTGLLEMRVDEYITKGELNTSKELLQSHLPPPLPAPSLTVDSWVFVCLPEKMTKLWVCKGNTAGRLWFQLSEAAPRTSPPAVIQRVPRLENVLEVRECLKTILSCESSPFSNSTINVTQLFCQLHPDSSPPPPPQY